MFSLSRCSSTKSSDSDDKNYEHKILLIRDDSSSPEPEPVQEYRVYKIRWHLLFVFSLMAFLQGFEFTQFTGTYQSMKYAFGWEVDQVAQVPLYMSLALTLGVLPGAVLLDRFGLRTNVLIMGALTATSFLVRCVPKDDGDLQLSIVNFSSALNGLASSIRAYVPVVLSSKWFDPTERTVATAIGLNAAIAGSGFAPLIAPMLISFPDKHGINPFTGKPLTRSDVLTEYFNFTYVTSAIAVLAFLMAVLYFPEAPEIPPSPSAVAEKGDLLEDLKKMLKDSVFWRILIGFLMIAGGFTYWVDVMAIDLGKNGVDQRSAGVITFFAYVVGAVGSVLAGRLGDHFPGNLKSINVAMAVLAVITCLWIVLCTQNYIIFTLRQFYIPALALGVASQSVLSVSIEVAVENLYPLEESLIAGMMEMFLNALEFVFMTTLLFVDPVTGWMDWYLLASALIGLPFFITLPNTYHRLRQDTETMLAAAEYANYGSIPIEPDEQKKIIPTDVV